MKNNIRNIQRFSDDAIQNIVMYDMRRLYTKKERDEAYERGFMAGECGERRESISLSDINLPAQRNVKKGLLMKKRY